MGDGTFNQTNLPEQIVASNVTAIAAGDGYSLFLKNDGSLWGMGGNGVGQLGDGTYNTTNLPEQIVASNVTAIAAGYGHGLFLKSNGSLWGMGANDGGQLGDGTYSTFNGSGTNLPEQIIASNVTAIAAGDFHSLFLKSDGSLWGMGDNGYSELGVTTITGTTNRPVQIVTSNVTAIAAGLDHSLFLRSDGSLWGMGPNSALGNNGGYGVSTVPVQIVASNVTRIAGGNGYSLFLKSDGSLWAMGNNYSGTLGDGTYINTNRPEAIIIITPIITSQPISQTNVAGATVTFLVNAMSSQPMNFQWQKNGTNLFDGGNILGARPRARFLTAAAHQRVTDM